MPRKRTTHPAVFKAKVALAAIKGDKTVNELASQFGIHTNLIYGWKRQLMESVPGIFDGPASKKSSHDEPPDVAELFEQIGRLKMELEWLKKNRTHSPERLRCLIEANHEALSIRRQCELLGLNRSSYYLKPTGETDANLALMKLIDRVYTDSPFYGSRRLTVEVNRSLATKVNRKKVQRLMRQMRIVAIYPKPRLSQPGAGHRIYPYLLRNVEIKRVNQVWSTDITYMPMERGFMYLAAIIDWYSRFVLGWRLSNTLDGGFCLELLEEALQGHKPEVFNTDQGVQFTARSFTETLERADVKVSMDGRGRCLDNVFVERLWRSVKYEDIFIRGYESVRELERGLSDYFEFYNQRRPHQSLGYRTPAEVYRKDQSKEG